MDNQLPLLNSEPKLNLHPCEELSLHVNRKYAMFSDYTNQLSYTFENNHVKLLSSNVI